MDRTRGKALVAGPPVFEEPPVARFLFGDARFSWFWLIVRLYAGYEWLTAGIEKLQSPAWTGSHAGTAMSGFVKGALSQSSGAHPNVQGWYATFLQAFVLPNAMAWSYAISWGETLVGLGLIVGLFTGIAAFFGTLMNVNYLLAGAVSINPVLFIVGTWLVLAWKTAGWLGLDHWVLPALGTPWAPRLVLPGMHDESPPGQQERRSA